MTSSASSIRTIVSGGDSADRRNGELQFVSTTSGQGLGEISYTHDSTDTKSVQKFISTTFVIKRFKIVINSFHEIIELSC